MSVLFTTILHDSIILCADKLVTNAITAEVQHESANKIELWSPTVAVGGTGSKDLSDLIISNVHKYVHEIGLDNLTLEELADLFAQCYYATREVYTDMPRETLGKFMVAGKLSSGKIGAIQILVSNDVAETNVIEASEMPVTIIFAPTDVTDEVCNQLFQKAIRNTRNKNTHHRDLIEATHRKAVRYVSEHSKFVGPKSDYIVIKPNIPL